MTTGASIPREALEQIRAPIAAAGGIEIDPPAFQPLALILEMSGEAMRERLIVVQGAGETEMALRPDFTIPAARLHLQSGRPAGRYAYEGKAYRATAGAGGEPEEHLQIGFEVFADRDAPEADAEIAALAWRAASAGGRRDLSIVFGDVALFAGFVETLGVPPQLTARLVRAIFNPAHLRRILGARNESAPGAGADRLAALLASLPEADAVAILEDVWALAGVEPVGGRSAAEIVHRLAVRAAEGPSPRLSEDQAGLIRGYLAVDDEPHAALETIARLAGTVGAGLDRALQAWERRLSALAAEGLPLSAMRLVTGFAREFGYYDGLFFEVRSAALGDGRPVATGGRYDGIFARLGAPLACGAVGCMVRPARAWSGADP